MVEKTLTRRAMIKTIETILEAQSNATNKRFRRSEEMIYHLVDQGRNANGDGRRIRRRAPSYENSMRSRKSHHCKRDEESTLFNDSLSSDDKAFDDSSMEKILTLEQVR